MGEIKSALELAMEKVKSQAISAADIREPELIDAGKKLAAEYLKESKFDLQKALGAYGETDKKAVTAGIEGVLTNNIGIPRSETAMQENRRALEGLVTIKKNKKTSLQLCKELEEHLSGYAGQKQEILEQLKMGFEAQVKQAMERAGKHAEIDIESHPEFRKKLAEIYVQFDREYLNALEQFRKEIKGLQ